MPLSTFEKWVLDKLNQDTDVKAAKFGVKADGTTDNTDALLALAEKFRTDKNGPSGNRRRVRIHLSGRGITRGHLPWAPGIVWCDGELRPPTTGATKHLVYPIDPTWQGGSTGAGAHRAGFQNFTICGERGSWGSMPGQWIRPKPTGLTVTNVSGSLPAGDYGYQVAYRTTFGIGEACEVVHAWGATGAKLTWANGANTSDAQVVIYGRAPWARDDRKVLATLPVGTTTWTDTGTATPSGLRSLGGDLTAPSVVTVGSAQWIDGLTITDMQGTGYYSEWWAQSIPNEPWYSGMEAHVNKLSIEGCDGPGFVWEGPHDSHVSDLIVAGTGGGTGTGADELRDAVRISGGGPVVLDNVHVWGTHRYGLNLEGPTRVKGGASEGAAFAQVSVVSDQVIVGDLDVFYPNSATATGLQVGRPAISGGDTARDGAPFHASRLQFRDFGGSSGPAVDLAHAGKGHLDGMITQADGAGTKVAGLDPAKHDVHLINAAGANVINRLT